jgi:Golgi phosphoprotein 3
LYSDVLENAFTSLSDDDYEVAMKHVRELLDLDPDQETSKYDPKMEVMWAVVSAFNK